MREYEINRNTLALLPIDLVRTKVIENEDEYVVSIPIMKIIDKSCRFFGSSYNGRLDGTKEILGISTKAPIIIEESKKIIFFPTTSPRIDNCAWISLNNLREYKKLNNKAELIFKGGKKINLDVSYNVIDNQVLRTTRLYYLLDQRINF